MQNSFWQKLFVWLQYLLPHHLLSRLVGCLARTETPWIKTLFINLFRRRFGVDLSEAEIEDPDLYPSFNAFFTRALKADARPIAKGKDILVCPADGVISQIGKLRGADMLQAKGHHFSVYELLGGDAELASQFSNGSFATIYLSPRDYHRVHMPVSGTLKKTLYVPGRLFSVNQATARQVPSLFARNERLVCVFDTPQGPVVAVLVGAMIVAGIETVFAGQVTPLARSVQRIDWPAKAIKLNKGDELGRFLLGSTVILLFPEGVCQWRAGLGCDSPVRMGEVLGQKMTA